MNLTDHQFNMEMQQIEQAHVQAAIKEAEEKAKVLRPDQAFQFSRKIARQGLEALEADLYEKFKGTRFIILLDITDTRRSELFSMKFKEKLEKIIAGEAGEE